ncbi:DUF1415 domain-containing protein [Ramlibacter humi]|uniref:DUF1415 domain-containing protein n=1 Tax=Ramlibacter humi TaxID=2530451 RepID=A0A4Z0BJL7_9BURK|nr:DUF1415 domain-containing protein [Ramlibacter humi]TFY98990.1 DUF1415 domain-containing protein [Ramlibacter humi]
MANDTGLHDKVLQDTRRWLERAVIGLNLCPFAKAVYVKHQVRLACCEGADFAPVLERLDAEIDGLLACAPAERDTTLLAVPQGFDEFLVFDALVAQAERRLARRGLEGVLQLASFHPRFVFAGEDEDAIANFTNRSPWPLLHLLREDSMDRAVAAFPQADAIYEANIRALSALGAEGWHALGVGKS